MLNSGCALFRTAANRHCTVIVRKLLETLSKTRKALTSVAQSKLLAAHLCSVLGVAAGCALEHIARRMTEQHRSDLQVLACVTEPVCLSHSTVFDVLAAQTETILRLRAIIASLSSEDVLARQLAPMLRRDERNFDLFEAAVNELRETGGVV